MISKIEDKQYKRQYKRKLDKLVIYEAYFYDNERSIMLLIVTKPPDKIHLNILQFLKLK